MMQLDPTRIKELFNAALAKPEQQREAFVQDECQDDDLLRCEVQALLNAHDNTTDFMETPALGENVRLDEIARWADPDAALVGERIGRYQLTRVIASGGMGTVYEAHDEDSHDTVALKMMRPGIASRAALRRFEHEAKILSRLEHRGIAEIYEAGTYDDGSGGVPYFAMELISGARPITEEVKARDLGIEHRLALFADVCDAVHHGHQKGIIHRDLKPSNILVDSAGQPKVIDFGVARATDSDLAVTTLHTAVGQLVGTLQYMSPEQCEADPDDLDIRSDVYSLGVVFYELVCGTVPYDLTKAPVHDAVRIVREENPAKPSTIDHALSGDIETIALKALEKDRNRRYQSTADFAADIRRHLQHEPILARPPSAVYRFQKFARRNRAAVGGVLVALVMLIAATVVSTIFAVRESRAAQQARTETLKAQQIAGLLQDMLAEVDPSVAQGADTQLLRQILDKTSQRIETELAGQPEVEAAIRATLGNTYLSLGRYELAEPHLTRSLQLREEQLGPEHEDTLAAVQHLAYLYFNLGQFETAEPLYLRALEGQRRVLGQDDPATLDSLGKLGSLYRDQDRLDEAEPIYIETLQRRRRALGEEHVDTLVAMNNLAALYWSRGKYEEARERFAELLEIDQRVLGEEHENTVMAMFNLGAQYVALGQLDEAEPLYRQTMEIRQRVLGPTHSDTLFDMCMLGDLNRKMQRFDDAEPLLDEVVRSARASLPQGHWFVGFFLGKYGLLMYDLKRYAEAEAALLEAHELLAAAFGANHDRATSVGRSIVKLYDAWGKPDEAAEWRAKLPEPGDDAAPDS